MAFAVAQGRAYESCVQRLMSVRHGFVLTRVGGANDGGVDLRGHWSSNHSCSSSSTSTQSPPSHVLRPPTTTTTVNNNINNNKYNNTTTNVSFKVVVQCKYFSKNIGPSIIREFDGVLQKEPKGTVGMLATSLGLTDVARRKFYTSLHPMMLLVYDPASVWGNAWWDHKQEAWYGRLQKDLTLPPLPLSEEELEQHGWFDVDYDMCMNLKMAQMYPQLKITRMYLGNNQRQKTTTTTTTPTPPPSPPSLCSQVAFVLV